MIEINLLHLPGIYNGADRLEVRTMQRSLPMSEGDKALLREVPFISLLTVEVRQKMLDMATSIHYEPRDIIFREREPSDFFFCVLNGYVRLYRLAKDGKEADIRLCGPGETFAACFLYAEGGYRYNAEATATTVVVRFETSKVRALAERYSEIDKALVGLIAAQLLDSIDCLANDRLRTAPQRVANYLLGACAGDGQAASIRLPFSKSLLAGKLGLAPEALSRAFSTLRGSGVTVHGRLIEIEDPEALRSL